MDALATMPKYEAYKDSGIEKVGNIPSHWNARKVKFSANINMKSLPENTSKGFEFTYVDIGGVSLEKGIEKMEVFSFGDAPSRARRIAEPGDVIVSTVRTYLKAIASVDQTTSNYIYSTGFAVVSPTNNTDPKYLANFIKSNAFTDQVDLVAKGMSYPAINSTELSNLHLLSLPLEEQTSIANFLDKKTAQIDEAIAIKEKQIALLKERKQIIIQKAVTQGLDPNVPMKDSDVDWIGQIPEHWQAARVKHATKKISKGTTPSTIGREILDYGDIRFIKAENIVDGKLSDTPLCFIDQKTNIILARSSLSIGDILFVIAGATLGKTAVVSENIYPANTNQAVAFLRPNNLVESSYLPIWLSSNFISQLIWLDAVQSAQPNLSMEDLGNFPLLLPPKKEQIEIVNYLNVETANIDEGIEFQGKQIEKLKEYKTTLINSAVTGKIKVA